MDVFEYIEMNSAQILDKGLRLMGLSERLSEIDDNAFLTDAPEGYEIPPNHTLTSRLESEKFVYEGPNF